MNPETNPSLPSQSQPIGSLESMSPEFALIQFIGHRQTCGFPKSHFQRSDFILTEIRREHPNRAPQELRLSAPGVTVTLFGWRLDLLPELLANGRVNSIRAEDRLPADLIFKEPLVCYIRLYWPETTRTVTLLPPKAP